MSKATHKKEQKQKNYRLMNKNLYGKTTENLRKRIHIKLVSNEKDYLKWKSKPSYMSQKTFDNNLVLIRKNKYI